MLMRVRRFAHLQTVDELLPGEAAALVFVKALEQVEQAQILLRHEQKQDLERVLVVALDVRRRCPLRWRRRHVTDAHVELARLLDQVDDVHEADGHDGRL